MAKIQSESMINFTNLFKSFQIIEFNLEQIIKINLK